MLEAFRDGQASNEPLPVAPAGRRAPRLEPDFGETAAGPLADTVEGTVEDWADSEAAYSPRARGEGLPKLVPAALAVLLAGFWLGRASTGWWGSDAPADPVRAGDLAFETRVLDGTAGAAEPAAPTPDVALEIPANDFTADDLAFLDKENLVTLRTQVFDATPDGLRQALDAYVHLRKLGIPAVAPFVTGDLTYLCVGAAPSVKDSGLAELKKRLETIPGPPPRSQATPYATAFLINIDQVVTRD